jgi:plasmid maintenance system antidote protein VapI
MEVCAVWKSLSKAFGPSPEMWVRLQANYDLSQVRQDEITVAPYRRAS